MKTANEKWTPRLISCLRRGYGRRDLIADLIAGVTVGLVALPLAMAFGIASGVTPQAGIYTAVVAGFLISALGGSRLQIGGPIAATKPSSGNSLIGMKSFVDLFELLPKIRRRLRR